MLGGTSEARALAEALEGRTNLVLSLSLAGRTRNPLALPAPTRIGGFGGAEGLAAHLASERIDALIDATHPFAAAMSWNAARAAEIARVPLLALARPAWQPRAGDDWREAPDLPAALALIGPAPRRVFVALGRNEVRALEAAPQHHYVLRSVDPIEPPLAVPQADYVLDRGPFAVERETAVFTAHGIELILAKNSGGEASAAKLDAARALGLPVILLSRPERPAVDSVGSVAEALEWIAHQASTARRGV